jgi:Rieske Fe-S protein
MADPDKYPPANGRRRFVKGVVGSAAVSSIVAAGGTVVQSATSNQGIGGGSTRYVGIQNTQGPAPRGLPLVPVEINDDGVLEGRWPSVETVETRDGTEYKVAREQLGGIEYSSKWFQYCGVQSFAGTQPDADADNRFLNKGGYSWASDIELDAPVTVDQFDDYEEWGNGFGQDGLGKPLNVKWRDTEDGRAMSVEVLRTPELPKMIAGDGEYSILSAEVREFLDAATEQNFMAWLDKCTHFCCTPGFKTSDYEGAADGVYCQCHQSVYDPFRPVKREFVALPRRQ